MPRPKAHITSGRATYTVIVDVEHIQHGRPRYHQVSVPIRATELREHGVLDCTRRRQLLVGSECHLARGSEGTTPIVGAQVQSPRVSRDTWVLRIA